MGEIVNSTTIDILCLYIRSGMKTGFTASKISKATGRPYPTVYENLVKLCLAEVLEKRGEKKKALYFPRKHDPLTQQFTELISTSNALTNRRTDYVIRRVSHFAGQDSRERKSCSSTRHRFAFGSPLTFLCRGIPIAGFPIWLYVEEAPSWRKLCLEDVKIMVGSGETLDRSIDAGGLKILGREDSILEALSFGSARELELSPLLLNGERFDWTYLFSEAEKRGFLVQVGYVLSLTLELMKTGVIHNIDFPSWVICKVRSLKPRMAEGNKERSTRRFQKASSSLLNASAFDRMADEWGMNWTIGEYVRQYVHES